MPIPHSKKAEDLQHLDLNSSGFVSTTLGSNAIANDGIHTKATRNMTKYVPLFMLRTTSLLILYIF